MRLIWFRWQVEGVKRVIAGYTGGKQPCPTYRDVLDHTEALFIEFNPRRVSYMEILRTWRDNDYPWEKDALRYRSAIFTTTDNQAQEALHFALELQQTKPNCFLYVDIEKARRFYQAEEPQQDYISKQRVAARKQLIAWANDESPTGLFTILE